MIRSPIGLRIPNAPDRFLKDQLREAAQLGAKGVVVDAAGELNPQRLSATGRRDLRHTIRSLELTLIGLNLPTKRPFDTIEALDDRLNKATEAFQMAYELGTSLVLARVGAVPDESAHQRRANFDHAVTELGRRADHHGLRLGIETGTEPGDQLRSVLDGYQESGLGASLDPGAWLQHGYDPVESTKALGHWVIHAHARDASMARLEGPIAPNPRGFGFAPGVLEWEEFLGALEEINYAGFLTIWPDPYQPIAPQFQRLTERFARF